ncbi:PREDICTED: prolactin-releasing peptide receptor-like, partial [Priapulus caudatus]|uniref:Prolactin-releasing peptide receptor-like n=1 Tax=Priapulus caudatus TaxID=37621 RepID=A0ABM1DZ11_PRICU
MQGEEERNEGGISVEDPTKTYLRLILDILSDSHNETIDPTKPILRISLRYVYPLFIFVYSLVCLVGTTGNVLILYTIMKKRLRDPTYLLLGNMAVSDITKCVAVLPISLANLLIKNWIYGSFMCFFLPMLQYFPVHVSMLTYLTIAIERYRLILHPIKSRVPAGLCIIGIWVLAVCLVLPYAIYVKYIDLGFFLGSDFDGVGLCLVNVERNIEEYTRAMFVCLYAVPLAIIAFLYVKVSAEIKVREGPATSVSRVTWSTNVSEGDHRASEDHGSASHPHVQHSLRSDDDDFDSNQERRTQKYLITMVTLFAACWCPLNILTLVTHFVFETDNNAGYFDVTFILFSWIGFLSTCINPFLFASWMMSSESKNRLRGYFRFSNRRRSLPQSRHSDAFSRNGHHRS